MKTAKNKFEKLLFSILLFLSFFFFTYNYGQYQNPPHYWGNPSEMSRIYSAVALIETGHFNSDPVFDQNGTMKWQDPYDKAVAPDGKTYSDKPPLTVLLAVPVYAVWKLILLIAHQPPAYYPVVLWMRFWLATVPFLVAMFVLFRILRKTVNEDKAWLVLFAFAFATINASFANLFLSHSMTEMLVLLALYFTLNDEKRFLAGLFAGLAVVCEFTAGLFAVPLFVYLLVQDIRDKKAANAGLFVLGVLPSVALLFGYDWAVWGSPFALSYRFVPQMGMGDKAVYHITFKQIFQVLFGDSRGIFFYSPVLFFAVPGLVKMIREKRDEAYLSIAVAAVYLLFLFGYREWESGWSPGIRHFIAVLPLLAIPLAYELKEFDKKPPVYKIVFYSTLFYSVVMNVLPKMGYVFYPDKIPNPAYWAGAYYIWQKIFLVRLGNVKPLIGLIVYFAIFAAMSVLFLRKRAGVKFTKQTSLSLAIAAALFAGVLILPQNIDTGDIIDFYALSNDMPSRFAYYRHWTLEKPHGIRTEFPENQKYAEVLFLKVQKLRQAERELDGIDFDATWLSNHISEKPELYARYLRIEASWKVETEDYLRLHRETFTPSPAFTSGVRAKTVEYENAVLGAGDKNKAREMYEFLFYAYMLDGKWENEWHALQKYMTLKENWW